MAFQHVQRHCMVWSIGLCPRLATKSKLFNIHFTVIVIFNLVKVLGKPTWSPCETMSFKEAGIGIWALKRLKNLRWYQAHSWY